MKYYVMHRAEGQWIQRSKALPKKKALRFYKNLKKLKPFLELAVFKRYKND